MKKKTSKISVLTARLTCHVRHELGDAQSLHDATDAIEGLRRYAADLGETTIDVRVNRVPGPVPESVQPEPHPADDGLDIPEPLRRTVKVATVGVE